MLRTSSGIVATAEGLTLATTPASVYWIPSTIPSDGTVDATDDINTWLRSLPDGTALEPTIARFRPDAIYRVDESVGTSLMRQYAGPNQETAGLNRHHLILDGNGATIDWSQNIPTPSANRAGIALVNSPDCEIRDFTIVGPFAASWTDGYSVSYEWQHGIAAFFGSDNCWIHDNVITNSLGDSVSLSGSDGVLMEDNDCDGCGRMGVALTANDGVIVRGNRFDRVGYHVIDLEPETEAHPVENITIDGNTIRHHRFSFVGAESGVCTPRTNYVITDNVMENPGITAYPPIAVSSTIHSSTVPPGDCVDNLASGLTVTGNVLRSTQNNSEAIRVHSYVGAVVNDNLVHLDSPFSDRGIVTFLTCTGTLEVKRNVCVGVPNAYRIDSVAHGPGVASCGNTTSAGAAVPTACS